MPKLNQVLGYQVRVAAAALRVAMEAVLRPLGLSVSQYAALELLAQRPGLSVAELARGAFVSRQAMHGVLLGLERQGLVVRDEVSSGRALPAHLTESGSRLQRAASERVATIEARISSGLTSVEHDQVIGLLDSIVEALPKAPE